ncbi:MAG TPA: response regulator [Phycisphaerae bacterium]|nr:response regulator [Phycisphaerae bacterium]
MPGLTCHTDAVANVASASPQQDPTVYVVEDEPMVRNVVKAILESAGLRVEVFGTARAFLDACRLGDPGCLVLDLRLPDMAGIEVLAELKRRGIGLPAVVITGYADVATATRALKAGAIDFIQKPFDGERLLTAVRAALAADEDLRRRNAEQADITSRLALLTEREREVLNLIADGMPNRQIAAQLGIAQRTVEDHRAHIMRKMRAATLAELLRMVLSFRAGSNAG